MAVAATALLLSTGDANASADVEGLANTVVTKSLCVFDPGGASGTLYAEMKQYQNQAAAWGVNFKLKPYVDESVAASDFRNKKCDAVLLTGVTGKQFNKKTYSLEAMGLFTNYKQLQTAISALAGPKALPLNRSGNYETVGIYPAGAVFLYVRDRNLSSLPALAGKKIATIAGDPAAQTMVTKVGATPEAAQISNFASKFNNGNVDVCYSPATGYQPLQLYKGVGNSGGVVKFPIAQLTFQLYIRSEEFPTNFGDQSRQYVSQQFSSVLNVVKKAESSINSWISVPPNDASKYQLLLGQVRSQLVGQQVYDPTIVTLGERVAARHP